MRNILAVLIAATAIAGCGVDNMDDEQSETADDVIVPAAGSCSSGTTNGGHTAIASCSGFLETGTFRVVATCCLTHCSGSVAGAWAYKAGGTSTANCGSAYATAVGIQYGPPGG